MKKILLTITLITVTLLGMAQSPFLMNYQGVARNAVGNVIPNQLIGLRLSILTGGPAGAVVYSETRTVFTNAFGLFNVKMGDPLGITAQTGTIQGVNWTGLPGGGTPAGAGTKYLQVEIDPNGGTAFTNVGSTQMLSVPYALNAAAGLPVGPAGGDLTGTYPNPQILFPLIKSFNFPSSQLIGMTNTSTTGTLGAITGSSNSADPIATAILGTMTNTTQGVSSAAVRGNNLGTGNTGIGVTGTHAGAGWGVYGLSPSGIGVYGQVTGAAGTFGVRGEANSGIGVYGISNSGNSGWFQNTNAANTADALTATTNGIGHAVSGINTGTGRGGYFVVNNAASVADAIRAETNGIGASWGIRAISSGTNGAGLFQQTNTANTANNLQSMNTGLGRAGLFVINNLASTANTLEATNVGSGNALNASTTGSGNALNASTTGTGITVRISNTNAANTSIGTLMSNDNTSSTVAPNGTLVGVRGAILPGTQFLVADLAANPLPTAIGGISSTGIGVQGSSVNGFGTAGISNSGYGVAGVSVLPTGTGVGAIALGGGYALQTQGRLQFQGQGAATNFIMGATNATGDATWRSAASLGIVSGTGTLNFVPKWTPNGTTIGNSQIFDDGTNVGVGTNAPQHSLTVSNGTADAQTVTVRGYSASPAFWKGGAAFGFSAASVIMGQLNGVAQIGGHNSNLTAWAPLAINSVPGNNVGIGTATPGFALQVNHNGQTGILSKSLALYSVVDVDAANGDAAFRMYNNGVGQWNIRNNPTVGFVNDLQIFELGGGGPRMNIQDGTGNVGIGPNGVAAYRLDVEHSGSTGIRSRSTSLFSVVDIDAANGDAALRFQAAGIGQWNTRNNPVTNDYQWFELGGGGERMQIQDATGNVGIGGVSPAYRLDVSHGGATGIRSISTAGFSLVDIDAANGDAALRFYKAGTGMWNTRNRPTDDYYEWFELGGGGSRMVIQRGTGNVGIGNTTSPSFKLDVLHTGGTGARIQSSASFSVVDIDAFSGDAALRFYKAGVGQWNTRNNPITNDYQIFELGGGGERLRIEDGTGKVVVNGDFTALGVKLFTMDYPLDPTNKTLMHAAIESNEVLNSYSGNVVTDASGKVTVSLPDYFEAINKDFRYQLTVVGGGFAQAIISKEISNNKFEIATNQPNIKVSWMVMGVRNDKHMQQNPFSAVEVKNAAQKGKYIDPKAWGMPDSKGVSYSSDPINSNNSSLNVATPKKTIVDNSGSVAPTTVAKPIVTKQDNSGSIVDSKVEKAVVKPIDNSGSVAPVTEKKVEPKVVPVNTNNSTNSGLVIPAATKEINYVTPPVNNTKPVEVPAQKIDNVKDSKVQEVKPLIGKPVPVNPELLKEKPKGN